YTSGPGRAAGPCASSPAPSVSEVRTIESFFSILTTYMEKTGVSARYATPRGGGASRPVTAILNRDGLCDPRPRVGRPDRPLGSGRACEGLPPAVEAGD